MDIKLLIALACLAARTYGVPVNGQKLVSVLVSPDALNRLGGKENDSSIALNNEIGTSGLSNPPGLQQNHDYNVKPVFEPSNPDNGHVYSQYQTNQPGSIQQPQIQASNQIPQFQQYQIGQQPGQFQQQPDQINQQPGQTQQPFLLAQQSSQQPIYGNQQQMYSGQQLQNQPLNNQQPLLVNQQQQQPYHINQQPGQIQQPFLVAQQGNQLPINANQQQMYSGQQLQNQPLNNQQPLLANQQQLMAQPIQTYQQPNPMFGSQPNQPQQTHPGQQVLLNQQTLPNQQSIVMQQPNGQYQSSNMLPVNPGQPMNQAPNVQNGNLFAMVPFNNQNLVPNQNMNTYLVPVQPMPNQMYSVNTG